MKLTKIILFSWLSLMFLLGSLHGAMLCVSSEGHVCLKFEGVEAESCTHSHDDNEDTHQHDDHGCETVFQGTCYFNCMDIPLSSGDIPDSLSRQSKIKTISFLRAEKSLPALSFSLKTGQLPSIMSDGPNISVRHLQTVVLLI